MVLYYNYVHNEFSLYHTVQTRLQKKNERGRESKYYRESTMKSLSLHPDSIKQSSQTSPPPSNDFLLPVDSDQAHCQC